jgi:aminomethyltransferase
MLKRTSLHEEHQKLGARLIDFGGWEMPVQYPSGLATEHHACRKAVALFDVSHMGEILIEGDGAQEFLNFLLTNDLSRLNIGQAQYSVMCSEDAGIVDDLVTYRLGRERFLAVVNASNTTKDFQHFQDVLGARREQFPNVKVTDQSTNYSQIAVQGPQSTLLVQRITSIPLSELKTYWFHEGLLLGSIPAIIARTGYTGEDGFELYFSWDRGPEVWCALLDQGASLGVKPCGLGARDTLRTEMKFPLYGQELTEKTNPLEAGLGWVTKIDKPSFMGKEELLKIKKRGISRKLIGLRSLGREIPRSGYAVFNGDGSRQIGYVTSGTHSPSLNYPIGIAYVDSVHSEIGLKLLVEVRGSKIPAEIVSTPFYKRT